MANYLQLEEIIVNQLQNQTNRVTRVAKDITTVESLNIKNISEFPIAVLNTINGESTSQGQYNLMYSLILIDYQGNKNEYKERARANLIAIEQEAMLALNAIVDDIDLQGISATVQANGETNVNGFNVRMKSIPLVFNLIK